VTGCRYDAGAGRAMAFGLPTRKHFRISFNYWARNHEGVEELQTGEFAFAKAIPQGTLFVIRYDPEAPEQNTLSASAPVSRSPLIAIGIIGSIVLSITWFAILHGCN